MKHLKDNRQDHSFRRAPGAWRAAVGNSYKKAISGEYSAGTGAFHLSATGRNRFWPDEDTGDFDFELDAFGDAIDRLSDDDESIFGPTPDWLMALIRNWFSGTRATLGEVTE